MNQHASPAVRWTRAAFLACVVIAFGSIAHVQADGNLPHWPVLVGLVAAAAVLAAPLLRREVGRLRAVGLVAVGQGLVHLLLTALSGHGTPERTATTSVRPAEAWTSTAPRTGSLKDLVAPHVASTGPAGEDGGVGWLQHLAEDFSGDNVPMALAHLIAAGAVGLWLAAGERALWSLLALTRQRLAGVVALLTRAARLASRQGLAGPVPPTATEQELPSVLVILPQISRRGPPALAG